MDIKFYYLTVNMDLTRLVGHTRHRGSLVCSSELLMRTELHFFHKLLKDLVLSTIKENTIILNIEGIHVHHLNLATFSSLEESYIV